MSEENSQIPGATCTWEPPAPKPEILKPARLSVVEDKPSTPSEFRDLAEFEPAELVPLPSGKKVSLRKPRPLYFVRVRKGLPQSVAARVQAAPSSEPTDEELITLAKFWVRVWKDIFVNPRIWTPATDPLGRPAGPEEPGEDEIDPQWVRPEDAEFIMRWAVGEVASDGSDLAAFRDREAGASVGTVRPGADVSGDTAQRISA
jgi:hypothetical protein